MTTSYPGVYMREVSSGVRPIQAASTSTAAFLGVAERGPIGVPVRILNFTQYQAVFGGFLKESFLPHGVYAFFNNGGAQCYVVRVAGDAKSAAATIVDGASSPHKTLTLEASSAGVWGNALEVEVADSATDPDDLFDLVVYLTSTGERAQVERLSDLSMDPELPSYVEAVVRTRSKYLVATDRSDPANAGAGALTGTSLAGVDPATLLDSAHRSLQVSLDGDGFQTINLAGDVTTLEKIRGALETALAGVTPLRRTDSANPYPNAKVTLVAAGAGQALQVTSGTKGPQSTVAVRPADAAAEDAAKLLRIFPAQKNVGGAAALRPTAAGNPYLIGDGVAGAFLKDPVRGTPGDTPQTQDWTDAFHVLDTVRDVSLVAVPGVGDEDVVAAGMNYCGVLRPLSDCFFIGDVAWQDDTPDRVAQWQGRLSPPSSYGAAYYPWLKMPDPNGGPDAITVPPSGFVAGIYARTDAQRGVWKAPAGVAATVAGSVGLAREVSDVENGNLNTPSKAICVIRSFPAAGTVVWGARTLGNDAEWRYISPRRMAIFLRKSIFDGIQWAVFEPNDNELWSQLRLNLNAFMMTLFRQGAFQGSTPDQAFFVKVDGETTTQADIDAGQVNILVGFAPLKPAEFVVVQLSQKAGQTG